MVPPLPASRVGTARTAGTSQRSLTPGGRRSRVEAGSYSPQPRAPHGHLGPSMGDLQVPQLGGVPWAHGGGSGHSCREIEANTMSGAMSSFILTRPQSLSGSSKAADVSAAMVGQGPLKLHSAELPVWQEPTRPPRPSVPSPQPSRSPSPMPPGSPMQQMQHPSNTPLIIAHRQQQQPP